jgi:hypothetical protein
MEIIRVNINFSQKDNTFEFEYGMSYNMILRYWGSNLEWGMDDIWLCSLDNTVFQFQNYEYF